jgi:hypothetical protein
MKPKVFKARYCDICTLQYIPTSPGQKWCPTEECKRTGYRRRQARGRPTPLWADEIRVCINEHCRAEFVPQRYNQKFCRSINCARVQVKITHTAWSAKQSDLEVTTRNRRNHLIFVYGITVEMYDDLFARQGNRCKLCKSPDPGFRWCIDHDHRCCYWNPSQRTPVCGKCIRGILCSVCNRGEGVLRVFQDRLKLDPAGAVEVLDQYQDSRAFAENASKQPAPIGHRRLLRPKPGQP